MQSTGITANLSVADLAEARDFYVGFLGLSVDGFDLGWVVNLHSPDGRAVVQLVTRDATSPVDSVISVHVGDEVEAAYEEAQRRGFEIVHPLTTEPWGAQVLGTRAGRQHRQPQGRRRLAVLSLALRSCLTGRLSQTSHRPRARIFLGRPG